MAKKTALLLPSTNKLLIEFGERLKLARLRRKLTAKQVAERAGMSPITLRSLEAGGSGVTMGAYLSVMQVLGLANDLAKLVAADELGRQLQDARLTGNRTIHSPPDQKAHHHEPQATRTQRSASSDTTLTTTNQNSRPASAGQKRDASTKTLIDSKKNTTSLSALLKKPKGKEKIKP